MKKIIYFALILFSVSCASVGYNNLREENNSFSIKVENVDGCSLSTPKINVDNSSIELKKNESLTISLNKLNKKNRYLLISHPDYENQVVTVKKTPRIGILVLDILVSPLLLGFPILIDPFKSDFYKVSKSSKELIVNLKISQDGINRKIEKCFQNLDVEAYKSLIKEFPYMFNSDKIFSDISKIVYLRLLKCKDESNIIAYKEIVNTYREYVDTSRINEDILEINKSNENINRSDKISSFLKINCENALYIDFNETNKSKIFQNIDQTKINNSNIDFVEDRYSAKKRALNLTKCPPISLVANYKGYSNDYGIGFWCKSMKNENFNIFINSEYISFNVYKSQLELTTEKNKYNINLPTSLKDNEWNYIYIHMNNDQNHKFERIGHINIYWNDQKYSYDTNFGFSRPEKITIKGSGIIDEFAVYHENSNTVDWIRTIDEEKIEDYLTQKRLEKEASEKREKERLAKIQRLKDAGIDWILNDCWTKVTKKGMDGSKFNSDNEVYCFEENGICKYRTGYYDMPPPYINWSMPLHMQNHLAIYRANSGSEITYKWKLNDSKDELIIFDSDNPENELKTMKVDQNSKRIDW